jgi:hypothetical protein
VQQDSSLTRNALSWLRHERESLAVPAFEWTCPWVTPGLAVRNLLGLGEARVAYSTQSPQRDAEIAEKVFDGPAGLVC